MSFFLLSAGCDDDDDDDDASPHHNTDDDAAVDDDDVVDENIISPLLEGAVPYIFSGNLPVPSHRYDDGTKVISLDGTWKFREDPEEVGEDEGWYSTDFDHKFWADIDVPGAWNSQFSGLLDYKGVGWYATTFDVPASISAEHLSSMMIRLGAVFLTSKIFLNGKLVAEHQGGYTPIYVAADKKMKRRDNVLVVKADNRILWDTIPADTIFHPGSHGWWPYGGITRSVSLHRLPDPWLFKVEPKFASADGNVVITLGILASAINPDLPIEWTLTDSNGEEQTGIAHIYIRQAGFSAYRFSLPYDAPMIWSRRNPQNIYLLTLKDSLGGDEVTVRFGYRTFAIEGSRILLNDQIDYWHGINRHSDYPVNGSTETEGTIAREIERLQQLHANHIRPGHYPVDEKLLDALLDAGITVVEEIPVYQIQFLQMSNERIIEKAKQQLAEAIERDKNNPAILAWSVGNEYGNYWPSAHGLTHQLDEQAKRFDAARPTMAVIANTSCVVPLDFALSEVDLIGINQYYGWYMGDVSQAGACIDRIHEMYPDKPLIASEFGAGAVTGWYLPEGQEPGPEPLDDHSYTEDFQLWFLQQQFDQILARDYLSGVMPWVLADFRMEWDPSTGDPHPVTGMNLKGLVSHDRETEKMSFQYLSDLYAGLE